MDITVLDRVENYCTFFNDTNAVLALKLNFLKNKQKLEEITCSLSGIEHDGSKTWGEDGYYNGEKVEIKNLTYTGKTKINGRVKFHDLNLNRINEFVEEKYWLVFGCYNFTNKRVSMNEIIFGFYFDDKVADVLRDKIKRGKSDPEISVSAYEHFFEQKNVKVFYKSSTLSKEAFSPKLYKLLHTL